MGEAARNLSTGSVEAMMRATGAALREMREREVRERLRRLARTDVAVLLVGEAGAGCELAARMVHECSARAPGPFVVIDCLALAPTAMESALFGPVRTSLSTTPVAAGALARAHGGTLFIDGITALPVELQARLLAVMESGGLQRAGLPTGTRIDVRIVVAAHREPVDAVRASGLRAELYYLLRAGEVRLAPDHDAAVAIRDGAEAGAVAEIRLQVGTTLDQAERALIEATLSHLRGNKSGAAQTLGCSLKTLYNKLNSYAQLSTAAGA